MKKPPDKNEIRRHITLETDRFLASGGEIVHVEQGESAYAPGDKPPSTPLFNEPRTSRTPVDDVVAALRERRESKRRKPQPTRGRKPLPRKRVIYDDFGEPMRVVWAEE